MKLSNGIICQKQIPVITLQYLARSPAEDELTALRSLVPYAPYAKGIHSLPSGHSAAVEPRCIKHLRAVTHMRRF